LKYLLLVKKKKKGYTVMGKVTVKDKEALEKYLEEVKPKIVYIPSVYKDTVSIETIKKLTKNPDVIVKYI
jgi:hypothetical protein